MSANVPARGPNRVLDGSGGPPNVITESDVQDPATLARYLAEHDADLAKLKRPWQPRRIDFEDRAVDSSGTTPHRFAHSFGGRVRWWVVDWDNVTFPPVLARHSSTDSNTLVLVSTIPGTLTLRVEEAG